MTVRIIFSRNDGVCCFLILLILHPFAQLNWDELPFISLISRGGMLNCWRSCDKLQSHIDWINDIKSYCLDIPGDFPYPIIGDESRELAIKLDMIDENDANNPDMAMTVRALWVIDPEKRLRLSMHYPASTGRNVDEILRVIDSLQLTDKMKIVATPANWIPGEKVMILPGTSENDVQKVFPNGADTVLMPSGKVYIRTTTDY